MVRRRTLSATAVALALLVVASGCSAFSPQLPEPAPVEAQPVDPVLVTRGSIVSVATAPVLVVGTPILTVATPIAGVVSFTKKLGVGTQVAEGAVVGTVDGQPVVSPVAGTVTELLVSSGTKVQAGIPVIAIQFGGFGVAGSVPADQGYRLVSVPGSARVQIDPGPGPAPCLSVQPRFQAEPVPNDPRLSVLCLLSDSTGLVPGLPGTLGITMAELADVLLLPLASVAGSSGSARVSVVKDGVVTDTEVELGVSDGVNVEIISGVSEGDAVLPWGPDLAPLVVP